MLPDLSNHFFFLLLALFGIICRLKVKVRVRVRVGVRVRVKVRVRFLGVISTAPSDEPRHVPALPHSPHREAYPISDEIRMSSASSADDEASSYTPTLPNPNPNRDLAIRLDFQVSPKKL